MKRFLLLLLLLLPLCLHAEQVTVRLYSTATIPGLTVHIERGHYRLYADDTLLIDSTLSTRSIVKMRDHKGRVALTVGKHNYGSFVSLKLVDDDSSTNGILGIAPDQAKPRSYEGCLRISHNRNGGLLLVNQVDLETYLAGVVQSEIYGDLPDIYKVQAVISRTWALLNLQKHKADGYNFCDHVHCQAYHNRCTLPLIATSVEATAGQVLKDPANQLIETPFHANSGGETANSEDVWRNAFSYLRSVADTFSLGMKQSSWEKSIPLELWLQFIRKESKTKIDSDSLIYLATHFNQPHRQGSWMGIPLKKFRTEFKLKSTFFDVEPDSAHNQVLLHGRGYGHGVGLSQEGAIRQAQCGRTYEQILLYYYPGSHLSPTSTPSPQPLPLPMATPPVATTQPAQPADSTSSASLPPASVNKAPTRSQKNKDKPTPKPKNTQEETSTEDSEWEFDW